MKKNLIAVIAVLASIYTSNAQTPEDNPFSRVQTQMEAMREAASRKDNAAALRLYESLGFAPTGTRDEAEVELVRVLL